MSDTDSLPAYQDDFAFLKRCLDMLHKELEVYESTPDCKKRVIEGYFTHMPNGCSTRVVLPHGGDVVQELKNQSLGGDCVLYFVGFIGYVCENVQAGVTERAWGIDKLLKEELTRHEDIVSYLTAERSPGGDWGNLVVFRHPRAVEKWRQADIHDEAAITLSPEYYSKVRIHRGTLQKGLCSDKFGVERTLFLSYDNEQRKIKSRYIKTWEKEPRSQMDYCYAL